MIKRLIVFAVLAISAWLIGFYINQELKEVATIGYNCWSSQAEDQNLCTALRLAWFYTGEMGFILMMFAGATLATAFLKHSTWVWIAAIMFSMTIARYHFEFGVIRDISIIARDHQSFLIAIMVTPAAIAVLRRYKDSVKLAKFGKVITSYLSRAVKYVTEPL